MKMPVQQQEFDAFIRALGEVFRKRLDERDAKLRRELVTANASKSINLAGPEVRIDMTPVAEAIRGMGDALAELAVQQGQTNQILAQFFSEFIDSPPRKELPILRLEVDGDGTKRIIPEVA